MKITVTLEFNSPAEAASALARLPGPVGAAGYAEPLTSTSAAAPAPATKSKAEKPPKDEAPAASPPSAATAPTDAPAPAPVPAPAPAPAPSNAAPPLAALSEVVARAVNANRAGTIAKLAEYGAKKASEVPEDKRAECIAALKGLVDAAAVAG